MGAAYVDLVDDCRDDDYSAAAVIDFLKLCWKPLAILAFAAAVWWAIHHYGEKRYADGRHDVEVQDARASDELRREVSKLTAEKAAMAAAAKAHYDDEHARTMVAAATPVGTSELCKPAPNDRGRRVPEAGAAHSGDAASPATAGVVREVPTPDHGQSDDRRRLLGALAALADEQSAVIREFQAR